MQHEISVRRLGNCKAGSECVVGGRTDIKRRQFCTHCPRDEYLSLERRKQIYVPNAVKI